MGLLIRPDPDDAGVPTPQQRQDAIVDFIREHIEVHGYPPSMREIGDAVGLSSTSSVHHQLCRLEQLGVLVRSERRSRAICVVEAA